MLISTGSPTAADYADVRATNLAVVLRFVRAQSPCSRADIAAGTGLNKATVSSLVTELIDRAILRETGLTENRVGRPATNLVLDGGSHAALGLEVNVDHVTATAVDLAGEPVLTWQRAFTPSGASGADAAAVAAIVRRALTRLAAGGRQVLGLGVAVPGLVDGAGVVQFGPNLGWHEVDLAADLRTALREPDFPVLVGNDANLAVLAEQRFGSHAGASDLVYLTGEIGVGAGVIMDGRLRRGGLGYSGEIGHIELEPGGAACRCGRRGCLEAVAGIGVVLGRDLPPAEIAAEIEETARRARAGDDATLALLATVGHQLGKGVSIVANLLNPQAVLLGGYYVPLAPWLLPAMEAEIAERVIAPGGCQVAASALGTDAAALGGAAMVLDSVDSGDLPARRA